MPMRRLALVGLALVVLNASGARGFADFGEVFPRAQGRTMEAPALACVGDFCVVASDTTAPVAGILVTRSVDKGESWDPSPTMLSIALDAIQPRLSCAGAQCMAVWRESDNSVVAFATSTAPFEIWSSVATLPLTSAFVLGTLQALDLSCWDDDGELHCVLSTTASSAENPAVVIRYDGSTWLASSIQTLATVTSTGRNSNFARVGCDPDGDLCVTAFEGQVANDRQNSLIFVAQSRDDGATWSTPVSVAVSDRTQVLLDQGDNVRHRRPTVACLDLLTCIIASQVHRNPGGPRNDEIEVAVVSSNSVSQLSTVARTGSVNRDARRAVLACDEDAARCVIAWEDDNVGRLPSFSVSLDRGATWSAPADMGGLVVGADQADAHNQMALACANGRCHVVLESLELGNTFQEGIIGTLVLPAAPDPDEQGSAEVNAVMLGGIAAAVVVAAGVIVLVHKRRKRRTTTSSRTSSRSRTPKKAKVLQQHETLSPGFTFSLPDSNWQAESSEIRTPEMDI